MANMRTTAVTRESAELLIWKACNELRSHLPVVEVLDDVLEVLLWARWIPTSEVELIGYYDAMRSVVSAEEWTTIRTTIAERSGTPIPGDVGKQGLRPVDIERLRAHLLPIGRALSGGDLQQSRDVIEAMLKLRSDDRRGGGWGSSSSMDQLWSALVAFHPRQAVACLFAAGVAAAPVVAMDHSILVTSNNINQQFWVYGLLSLYPQAVSIESIADHLSWPLAIVAPPWGEKARELLIDDPWLPPSPLDCPSAIRDSEARRVFAAHQRCSGTTYALMSSGIGFRTSRDLEFLREELVRKNWLDAVVSLPAGAMGGTRVEGLLLVLKQDREPGAPIQIVAAHELLTPSKVKSAREDWDPSGVKELAQLLNDRRDGSYARLVTAEELEANGFSFQVSRYLHSEGDLMLQRYLDSRTTVQLGDLAEIKRPVASLGRQEDDGIEVREVTPGDIDDSGQLLQGSKLIRLPEAALAKVRQQLLEPGDVLLSIKGALGKVAVVQDLEHPTVPGQAFCVVRLRPNAHLTPAALVQYLRSAVGQTLLNKAGQGAAVSFVPMGEVKGLPIVIPSASELQRAKNLEQESVALSREVEELSRNLQRLSRQGWMEDLPPKLVSSTEEVSA